MIALSDSTLEFLNKNFPMLKVRDDKVLFKGKTSITIPSKLYPLGNQRSIKLFTFDNTKKIEDENIAKIFDSLELPIGRCYSNTLKLINAFNEHGITDIKAYSGWMIVGNVPIHHCWAVYKDIHVLDGGVEITDMIFNLHIKEANITDINEQRKILADITIQNRKKKNSKIKTFGFVLPMYLYIGTETTPEEGATIFNNLIDKYPNHPSYSNDGMNSRGASKLQEMVHKITKSEV